MKPGHSDVDSRWGNGELVEKLLHKSFEGNHLRVIDRRRVIDQNPNVHFLIAGTLGWDGNVDVGPLEGLLFDSENTTILEHNGADLGASASTRGCKVVNHLGSTNRSVFGAGAAR